MEDLERVLKFIPTAHGKLIVVDGVFSMEGDISNLPGIIALAKEHGAKVMVDDAHGFGVMGTHGRGTAEYFGLEDEGVYVNPVISPAVKDGEALIRTSYTATHTKEQLDFALNVFNTVLNRS